MGEIVKKDLGQKEENSFKRYNGKCNVIINLEYSINEKDLPMMPGKINSLLHVHWRMPKRISSIPNKIRNSIISDLYLKILLLLTVTGFILRLYHLGDVSIWLDEGFTHLYSSTSFFDIWHICFSFEQNPPLYYWIEHVILQFGDSEVILRIFSVIIGTLTIPLIFYAGKEFYNEDIGIISAALLTFSTFHILYSQEARSYSLLVFFLTIALIWYLKSVQTNDVKTWFIFGIFSALAIWTHYFAIIPIGTLFLYVLIYQMKTSGKISSFKPILLSGLVVLILSSPLFIMMLNSLISKVESAMTMNWGIQGFSLIIRIFSDNLGPGKAKALLLGTFMIIGLISLFWAKREKFLFLIFIDFNSPASSLLCIIPDPGSKQVLDIPAPVSFNQHLVFLSSFPEICKKTIIHYYCGYNHWSNLYSLPECILFS